ncbi:DnaJ domain-containing protein [Aestuariivirga sp.]|uniref:DnaJ domain-containing protein n=1 Tax=Aestuariivirga sp. TaxID=2650926 RepID=UPI00391C32E3
MESFPDHYAALGIDPTADQEVITAAYRALAKKFHPDTGSAAGTASPERFAEIQQAYEVLGKPDSRRAYDLELLEATKRELEAHLAARKRRLEHRTGTGAAAPPPPDLGDVRPEPRPARHQPFKEGRKAERRQLGPFLVLGLLVAAVLGGIAWALLGTPPVEPELASLGDAAEQAAPAVPAKSSKPEAEEAPAAAPGPVAEPEPVPEAEPERPLFGSSATDPLPEPPRIGERAAETAAAPEPAFGTEPPPVPKVRPARPVQPAVPATPPAPARRAEGQPFTLVIYEQDADGEVFTERANVAFNSEARCEEMGGDTVSRRRAAYDGEFDARRIWYECLSAAEMR